MINLLVQILVYCVVFALVWWGIGLLGVPSIITTVVLILGVLGLVLLILRAFGLITNVPLK